MNDMRKITVASDAMIRFDADEISKAFTINAYVAGMEYADEGRVRNAHRVADGGIIQAQVQGSRKKPYQVVIRLSHDRNNRLRIAGTCSCPVGINCKHVAATLLEIAEQEDSGIEDTNLEAAPTDLFQVKSLPETNVAELEAWIATVAAATEAESEDYPATIRQRMVYVLTQPGGRTGVTLEMHAIELRKDGALSAKTRRCYPHSLRLPTQQPKFLRPSDRRILRRLIGFGDSSEVGEEFTETLRHALATGRARWRTYDGPAMQEGPKLDGDIHWKRLTDGSQRPEVTLPQGVNLLLTPAPWYVDPKAGLIGPLGFSLPDRVVAALLAAPAISPVVAGHVGTTINARVKNLKLPVPTEIAPVTVYDGRPVPHLRLSGVTLPFNPFAPPYWYGGAKKTYDPHPRPTTLPIARLSFQYGPFRIPQNGPFPLTGQRDGVLYRIVRDTKAEAACTAQMRVCQIARFADHGMSLPRHDLADAMTILDSNMPAWIDFMELIVPKLEAKGWVIETEDSFPVRLASLDGEITAELIEAPGGGSGIDWFDLELGAMVDDQRIDLLPVLRAYLSELARDPNALQALLQPAKGEDTATMALPLPGGRLLRLPMARMRPFIATILELFSDEHVDPASGRTRLRRHDIAQLAEAEASLRRAGIVWHGGEALRTLARHLHDVTTIPQASLPAHLEGVLRPYQSQGVAWLQFLRQAGLGGILGDDMGLGKTVQALAHLAIEQLEGRLLTPALVICPTSLVPNWRSEAARFAPGLRVLTLHGPDRHTLFSRIDSSDLVITTYPLLTRDSAALTEQDWHVIILDEAQTIKNPDASTTRLAGELRGSQRLCLSGTPLENHLGELWSLFDFLMPGFLGERTGFNKSWRQPIEKQGNRERQRALARRVAPFLLRRTKDLVAAELPAKTEIVEEIELGAAQRAVYEGIRLTMHARVQEAVAERGLARSGIIILDALLKLRQACCDPRLLKLAAARGAKAGSAKLERLMEMLTELLDEGRAILLFSQFTSMLALIEEALTKLGIPYVLLTGDTKDRATPVRQFQAGKVKLFLISLKAGGVGLNLTAADTVIHYDPWWNPAVENQATDRAHRIGQDKKVFVHRLITKGTIEEKMEILKSRKQALVDGILSGGDGMALAMTEADIEALFAEE